MKITGTAIRLGAVSLVLLLCTAALIVVFGQIRFDRTSGYSAVFSNGSGIRPGQFVRASGVEIGKVSGTELIDHGRQVLVHFAIDSTLPLYQTTTAQIRYADLIGNRYLELGLGSENSGPVMPAGSTIPVERTQPALDLDALIGGFRPLLRALDPEKVNNIASSILVAFQGQGGTIADILDQTAQLTSTLADRDQTVGEVINNLNTVLDTTIGHLQGFDHTINDLHTLITGLEHQADPLAEAVSQISNASGTLADLLADQRPILKSTIAQLQTVETPLVEQKDQLDDLLTKLPNAFRIIGRMGGVYGNFFNFYLCDLTLKTFGLQPGGPVRDVRLTVQPSGRCTPR
jgi:phospholipid/cholesterol/gamma-HCH transport system substrate-binding protein